MASTTFVLIIINLLIFIEANDETKLVEIKNGILRGRQYHTLLDEKPYYAFKGIPYAEPPIDHLRFKPPIELGSWQGIKDTFEYGSDCVQFNEATQKPIGSEDCLFLNVYVPAQISTDLKLPVMVFIHGGGYIIGTASFYGPDFLIENGVILVTLNYRLGPFGFISLGTNKFSGNMGLKDQLAAVKWVNDNIEYFGGNKSSITLFGQSAGSVSTELLLLSPVSHGLFQNIILESGSYSNPWAYYTKKNHLELLNKIYSQNGKTFESQEVMLKYLLSIDAHTLSKETCVEYYEQGKGRKELVFVWSPVIENSNADSPFLTSNPEYFSETSSDNINTLIGFTAFGEAYGAISQEMLNPDLLIPFDNQFEVQLPLIDLQSDYGSKEYNNIAETVRHFYFGEKGRVNNETLRQYSDLISDSWMIFGIDLLAKRRSIRSNGKTYYYRFSLDTHLNGYKIFSGVTKLNFPGAAHSDDLCYIFRMNDPLIGKIYENLKNDSTEVKAIRDVTKLWTNFAKYGNPTPNSKPVNFKPIENNKINFLDIKNDALHMGVSPYGNRMKFWIDLFIKHFILHDIKVIYDIRQMYDANES